MLCGPYLCIYTARVAERERVNGGRNVDIKEKQRNRGKEEISREKDIKRERDE